MTDISLFTEDFKANKRLAGNLYDLCSLRQALLDESEDSELKAANAALTKARAAYKAAALRVVLADEDYTQAQKEIVRAAVHEWSRKHDAAAFARWFDDNGKDEQKGIFDTTQRLSSHVKSLYDAFTAGVKVARRKKQTAAELKVAIAARKAEQAELEKQLAEIEG